MSGTNHRMRMWKEYERRLKKKDGKYDLGDFAYDLYRANIRLKNQIGEERIQRDRIEYGL